MNPRLLTSAFVLSTSLTLSGAEQKPPAGPADGSQLPPVKTEARKLRSYSVVREGWGTPHQRLTLREKPRRSGSERVLIDGVHNGDYIVSIDGVDVRTLDEKGISRALTFSTKLEVMSGLGGTRRWEVDCYQN